MTANPPESVPGDRLAAAVSELAVEVRGYGVRTRRERISRLIINAVIAVGVLAVVVALVVVGMTADDAKNAAEASKSAQRLIVSCTDSGQRPDPTATPAVKARPPGACYAKNQADSAPLLNGLTDPRAKAASAYCALKAYNEGQPIEVAERCAMREVKDLPPLPLPTPTPTPTASP